MVDSITNLCENTPVFTPSCNLCPQDPKGSECREHHLTVGTSLVGLDWVTHIPRSLFVSGGFSFSDSESIGLKTANGTQDSAQTNEPEPWRTFLQDHRCRNFSRENRPGYQGRRGGNRHSCSNFRPSAVVPVSADQFAFANLS